jgi:hypothetical protein
MLESDKTLTLKRLELQSNFAEFNSIQVHIKKFITQKSMKVDAN